MIMPTTTITMLARNGTRQPQDISASSGSMATRPSAAEARSCPREPPVCVQLP
jgi:hypothetical protein